MSMTIRKARAVREDAVALYKLLCEMYSAVGLDMPRPVKNRIFERIRASVEDGVTFLAERNGEVVGALGVMHSPAWWSDQGPFVDTFFYVRPSARAGGTAKQLVREAERYVHSQNNKLVISLLTGVDLPRKEAFLERLGGKKIAAGYIF